MNLFWGYLGSLLRPPTIFCAHRSFCCAHPCRDHLIQLLTAYSLCRLTASDGLITASSCYLLAMLLLRSCHVIAMFLPKQNYKKKIHRTQPCGHTWSQEDCLRGPVLAARSNFTIRYWSWNCRGCWHQACPQIDSH